MTVPVEILELWQHHSTVTFPKGYGNKEVKGIDLPLLDAEIAGLIHNGGKLEFERVKSLRKRLIDLNNIILLLDRDELIYFELLRKLANLILQEVENN